MSNIEMLARWMSGLRHPSKVTAVLKALGTGKMIVNQQEQNLDELRVFVADVAAFVEKAKPSEHSS